jgi:putative hydrolase
MTAPPGQPPAGDPGNVSGGIPLFDELERLLSSSTGPVNWELARQVAVRAASQGDREVTPAEATAVEEAARLADLWLDSVTVLPSGLRLPAQGWTRVRWVEATLPVWGTLCDPVAARVVEAMGSAMQGGLSQLQEGGPLPLPPGMGADPAALAGALGPVMALMNQIGSLMFGAQVGQALGTLAQDVLTGTDIGLPLGPGGVAALLPLNVARFGEGLSLPADEVRIYLALREAAHQRLFAHVGWLSGRLLGAVDAYARTLVVDVDAMQRAIGDIDPTDPAALQRALGGDLFSTEVTPEQQIVLDRLETLLALIEGWVDEVVDAAAGPLPGAAALRETIRRRRATGGPAEQTFATLVGLTLRPRRLREAAALWRAVAEARGTAGRDGVWDHPDLLPGADDLADPTAYLAGLSSADPGTPDSGAPDPDSPDAPSPET